MRGSQKSSNIMYKNRAALERSRKKELEEVFFEKHGFVVPQIIETTEKENYLDFRDIEFDFSSPRLTKKIDDLSSLMHFYHHPQEKTSLYPLLHSISENGYLPFEPLLIDSADQKTCLDGNRRLACLKIFNDKNLQEELNIDSFHLSGAKIETQIPVNFISRKDSLPILGFRHFNGILGWHPREKAEYFYKKSFTESYEKIAWQSGYTKIQVKHFAQCFSILEEAKKLNIEEELIEEAKSYFATWMSLMNREQTRKYIGLDSVHLNTPQTKGIKIKKMESRDLLKWVFSPHEKRQSDWQDFKKLNQALKDNQQIDRLRKGVHIRNLTL